jgi:hypothetical protein
MMDENRRKRFEQKLAKTAKKCMCMPPAAVRIFLNFAFFACFCLN